MLVCATCGRVHRSISGLAEDFQMHGRKPCRGVLVGLISKSGGLSESDLVHDRIADFRCFRHTLDQARVGP